MWTAKWRTLLITCAALLPTVFPVGSSNAQLVVVRGYDQCAGEWFDEVAGGARGDCRRKARAMFVQRLEPAKAPSGTKSFTISPIGRTTNTSRSVWFHPKLQVRVVNLNPYLYEYKIDVASTPISEPAVFLFFKALLPGLPTPKEIGESVGALKDLHAFAIQNAAIRADTAAAPVPSTPRCSAQQRREVIALGSAGAVLAKELMQLENSVTHLGEVEQVIEENRNTWGNPASQTNAVVQAALTTIDGLQDYSMGAPAIVKADAAFKPGIQNWLAAAAANINCGDDSDVLASLAGRLGARYKIVSEYLATIDLAKLAKDTKKEAQFLAAPLREPTSFFQESVLDEGSATVKVTVQRRPIQSDPPADDAKRPFVTVMTASTGAGVPRIFSLAVGLTSFADTLHSYQATKVYSGNLLGADSVANVITELSLERRKTSPLFLLDARLPILDGYRSTLWNGFGFQLGATVAKDIATSVEYVVGVSSHFFDDRVYVAWADYAAKEQRLAAGFLPGARLPSAQSTIPLSTTTRWHDVWILSFKLY